MAFGIINERHRYGRFSSIIEHDPAGFELWDMHGGEHGQRHDGGWWVPALRGQEIFGVLAEQNLDFYGAADRVRDAVVLDCGAHVGGFVRKALDYGAALVVAIEPMRPQRECLYRNCGDLIHAGRVVVVDEGVWSETTTLMAVRRWGCDALLPESADVPGHPTVPVTTIDALVERLQLPGVGFIKMDIEGGERHAIAGAKETLRRFRPYLALAGYHCKDDGVAIPDAIRACRDDYRIGVTFDGHVVTAE